MPFTEFLYGQPSSLIYKGDSSVTVLRSQEGVHQGDPLGPFYFCVAINCVLQRLQSENLDTVLLAYFDDINLLGPPGKIGELLPLFVKELESCGLKLNPAKCELYHIEADMQGWASGMRCLSDGVLLLGAAFGTEEFITEHYEECARDGAALLQGISELQSSQCAFLLLSRCANLRMAHITRLSPPAVTAEAASIHDCLIQRTLSSLLLSDHLPEFSCKQARLRVASGGLGLSSLSDQRHHAFLSSWADSFRDLLSGEPLLGDELRQVVGVDSSTPSARALRDCHQALCDVFGEIVPPLGELHLQPPKFQSKLGVALDKVHFSNLFQQADQRSRARLLSTSCRESGAWIQAVPTTQTLSLTSEEFRLGVLMRLGMPIPESRGLLTCPNSKCTSAVDSEGMHLLTCGMGPGRVRLHDRMVRAWNSLILSTGLRTCVEPRGLYQDQRRPDIVIPDFHDGRGMHLDLSLTHPCLPSNVSPASHTPGAAAAKREGVKRDTYKDCAELFQPIVMEHCGRWGPAALHFLDQLAKRARVSLPDVTCGQFRDHWLKRLGCELQRGIAFSVCHNAEGWHRSNQHVEELKFAILDFV